jgi:hypothetical protein
MDGLRPEQQARAALPGAAVQTTQTKQPGKQDRERRAALMGRTSGRYTCGGGQPSPTLPYVTGEPPALPRLDRRTDERAAALAEA